MRSILEKIGAFFEAHAEKMVLVVVLVMLRQSCLRPGIQIMFPTILMNLRQPCHWQYFFN